MSDVTVRCRICLMDFHPNDDDCIGWASNDIALFMHQKCGHSSPMIKQEGK